jgi:hypothetical protein
MEEFLNMSRREAAMETEEELSGKWSAKEKRATEMVMVRARVCEEVE